MPKSMLNLKNNGKQVTTLSDTALLLAMINPATVPDDAVIEWGALKTLLAAGLPVSLITGKTEDVNPDIAADFVLTYDTSAGAFRKVLLKRAGYGYGLSAFQNAFAPANATTYYFGSSLRPTGQTVSTRRKIFVPKAGTIKRADISIVNGAGTVGSAQTSSMFIRLNDTTDTLLSNAIVNTQASETASYFNITGLSIAVATGDFIEIKWVTPTWTTLPTNVVIDVQMYVEG